MNELILENNGGVVACDGAGRRSKCLAGAEAEAIGCREAAAELVLGSSAYNRNIGTVLRRRQPRRMAVWRRQHGVVIITENYCVECRK